MKKINTHQLAAIGILAAMVYVTSAYLQIPIPTTIGSTRLHMGNVMCLLSGLLLGPVQGGLAAGIGSMIFDLLDPVYISSAPFTFTFKFLMAFVCGIISRHHTGQKRWCFVGSFAGAITYVVLYLSKTFIEDHLVLGLPFDAVWLTVTQKALVSSVNGIIAALVSVPLYFALRAALKRTNLLPQT